MNKGWENCYVGLPYQENGRTREGIDCWGLVRLIHKEQMGVDLPSFTELLSEEANRKEFLSIAKEGWEQVVLEREGDVVVFNILGQPTHVGIIVRPGFFVHAYQDHDVRIERLDSPQWKKRIQGIYRYTEECGANLVGLAHPLRTKRIDTIVEAGKTLSEIHKQLKEVSGVSEEYAGDAVIYVDSVLIPKEQWDTLVIRNGQRIEYRATMKGGGGGGVLKLVAIVAVAYFAPILAGQLLGTAGVATGLSAIGMASQTFVAIASVAISMAGSMLVNAIFPTRPPEMNAGGTNFTNEQGVPSWFLQGGNNRVNKYGAIPVVLGTMRYTPPAAVETYYEAQDTTSYLRTVLCWGYGPLSVSDIKIGDESLDKFQEVEIETLQGYSTDNRTRFDTLYGQDVEQQRVGVDISENSDYVTRTLDEEIDQISLAFEYPQGLYTVNQQTGEKSARESQLYVEFRKQGDAWGGLPSNETIQGTSFQLQSSPKVIQSITDGEGGVTYSEITTYLWSSIVLDQNGVLVIKSGVPTNDQNTDPSGSWLRTYYSRSYSIGTTYSRLPSIAAGEIELYRLCVSGSSVITSTEITDTAAVLSVNGLVASISSFVYTRSNSSIYLNKKALSPFVKTIKLNVPRGKYEVRAKNLTPVTAGDSYNAARVTFGAITGYKNTKPIVFPKPLAMSAVRIKATNQINGQVDGFTGTVSSICKDWDSGSNTWVERITSNPASLYRYVLQHPANSKAVSDAKIDLVALQEWHDFCRINGYTYNSVLTSQQSLYEVMKDIAAAGRGSPTRYDGKWSILVDKPRNSISQHFTPHNSWGFEGSKTLPVIPHAFKVSFLNEDKGYQPDEMIVYNDGYNESNATLFEGLNLPGVTDYHLCYKHARFHLAQIKLRPETYVINADIEHLVCNRGDLVRVTHDVPLWGVGSGRIKTKVSSTNLILDEELPMQAGKQYTIRIRNQDGSSTVRTVVAKPADGYYSDIDLTVALGANEGQSLDLFLFGELGQESVDLIVLKVEPAANMSARLTLQDYSPAVYESDTGVIPAFNSQITLPAGLLKNVIKDVPELTIRSDDFALTEVATGVYQYGMLVAWNNKPSVANNIDYIEVQIDWYGDNTEDWLVSKRVNTTDGSVLFGNVTEGDSYVVRARYANNVGVSGKWSNEIIHTIQGRNAKPLDVENFLIADNVFSWKNLTAPDIVGYKIRYNYSNNPSWESSSDLTDGLILSSPYQAVVIPEGTVTFYIKAYDSLGNESETATKIVRNLGDSPVANVIVSYDYEAANYPGTLTGGVVSATDILANSNSLMYQADTLPFYDFDSTTFYVDNYDNVEWISSGYTPSKILSGSTVVLNYQFDGNAPQIWYRLTGPNPFYSTQDNSLFYQLEGNSSFYEPASEWRVWPGSIPAENTEYQFKFSDVSGPIQGRLNSFEVIVDAPDKILRLNDVAISSDGTRLTEAIGLFDTILNIQLTLQNSTADVLYAEDKSVTLGPLIKAKQGGTGVTATVDAFYKDIKK